MQSTLFSSSLLQIFGNTLHKFSMVLLKSDKMEFGKEEA